MIKISKSISTRLSIPIVLLVALLFVLSFWVFYSFSKRTVTDGAFDRSRMELEMIIAEIDSQLAVIEQSINGAVFAMEGSLDNPELLETQLINVLETNPIIIGSALAFEPYYFKDKGQYYMPYASRTGYEVSCEYFGGTDYDYHVMDWYLIPKLLDESYWAEPYYDEGGADMLMTTYTHPLRDRSGKIAGVITADLSLGWLTDLVVSMKPYANSYAILLSRNGYYLAHNDTSLILNESYFTHTGEMNPYTSSVKSISELGYNMLAQQSGIADITIRGEEHYAFYAPVPRVGWSATTVSRHSDVMSELNRITIVVWLILAASLVLIFVATWYVVKKITNPLKHFSASAAIIAGGDFNAPLPDVSSHDEVGELRDAFVHLQASLSEYIEELKHSTATKQRIESELAIAQQIQMGMVPKIFPPFPESSDLDIYATITPAKEVGGDLYDFFVRDGKLIFTIGDVSGKGIPASLLMAVSCSLFRSIASVEDDPAVIVSRINDSICASNEANMFVTMFVAVLDIETGEMNYCNAGHNPPFILSDENKKAEFLEVMPNIPVGVFDEMEFIAEKTILQRGQTIFMYTDGLTEAENHEKELYGEDRLCEYLLARDTTQNINTLCHGVGDSLSAFTAGNEQSDDITMLFVLYTKI